MLNLHPRFYMFAGLFICAAFAQAEENNEKAVALQNRPTQWQMTMERIELPNNESVGLLGASYFFRDPDSGFAFGPSVYGAVTGDRGGFFTWGGEAAWQHSVTSNIDVQAGFYVGGGGGHSAPVGGGLMLRPHIDLLWKFSSQPGIKAGISLSQVHFPSGDIKSNQLGLVLTLDDHFFHTSTDTVGKTLSISERSGIGFDRFAVMGSWYKPDFTDSATGRKVSDSVGLVGVRAEHGWNNNFFWGIEASAAGKGSASGYMEILGTGGWETAILSDRLFVGGRAGLGMGGGGSVSVGSGLLSKVALYSRYDLTNDIYVGIEGGYVAAPSDDFRAKYGMLSVGMNLDHPGKTLGERADAKVHGWEWSNSLQHYTSAARKNGPSRSLETLGLKIRRDIDDTPFYLTGQAHTAYSGGAGAYGAGLLGVGVESSLNRYGVSVGGEMLVGAAGGGGVDSDGGGIIQPMAYTSLELNKDWRVKLGIGKIKSIRGVLDSTVVDVSLSYAYGLPAR